MASVSFNPQVYPNGFDMRGELAIWFEKFAEALDTRDKTISPDEFVTTIGGTKFTIRGTNLDTDDRVITEIISSENGVNLIAIRNLNITPIDQFGIILSWGLGKLENILQIVFRGDDSVFGESKGDRLIGYSGSDYLFGGGGDDILVGDLSTTQTPQDGETYNDYLDGGSGADQMSGGIGDDIYMVDDARDIAGEYKSIAGTASAINGLHDLVYATVSYSLANQYVENIILLGDQAINATGNSLNNELTGNSAKNTLAGGKGDDRYFIQTIGDKVIEADKEGTDIVFSTVGFSLAGQYIENLFLQGAADINALGNSLDNFLSGNDGINELRGGKGNDSYYVQTLGDRVIEKAGEGDHDLVYSTVDFSLSGQYAEDLWLVGEDDIDGSGNSLNNIIVGNEGKNILRGYGGDDTYHVQTAGDQAVEAKDAGHDTVISTISYSLAGQYIENLTLEGDQAINATGNSFANILTGNAAKNILTGGRGNDTYYVQSYVDGTGKTVFDDVRELANEGTDRVFAEGSYSLAGRYVEELYLLGSGDTDATGNSLANILAGNSGANKIYGGGGYDRLAGGEGVDTFIWKATSESVAGTSDRVLDLEAQDVLDLSAIDANTTLAGNQGFQIVSSLTSATQNGAGRAVLTYDAKNEWTLLRLDTNLDGKMDSQIVLYGDHTDHGAWVL